MVNNYLASVDFSAFQYMQPHEGEHIAAESPHFIKGNEGYSVHIDHPRISPNGAWTPATIGVSTIHGLSPDETLQFADALREAAELAPLINAAFQTPVTVPADVHKALTDVRQSGLVNMYDALNVVQWLHKQSNHLRESDDELATGYDAAALWIQDNTERTRNDLYDRGVLFGFDAGDNQ